MNEVMNWRQLRAALHAAQQEDDPRAREATFQLLLAEIRVSPSLVASEAEAVSRIECAIRFRCYYERGFASGLMVMYNRVALPGTIQHLTKSGFVRLNEVSQEFDPSQLILWPR